ncbi:MAG TPA: methyltransferase domain-containing protein [Paracoccaceae bacterium]|nr:methyltransferase domain-containing protein [Paracoccaceae bacterium]
MPSDLRLTDDDLATLERDAASASATDDILNRVEALIDAGTPKAAAALCLDILAAQVVPINLAGNLVLRLRRADHAADADRIEADLTAQLRARAARAPADPRPQITLGRMLFGLGRLDAARQALQAALPRDPLNLRAVATLTLILLEQGEPDAAVALWQPILAADPGNGDLPLNLARMLASGGALDHARAMLDRAEPLCRDNRSEFDFVADSLRNSGAATAQAAMTIEVFDRFAASYDRKLAALGNRGPQMVGLLLDTLGLPAERGLAVLDAGCGTGLCAPLLRPYAKRLHGVDLSRAMLQQAQRKKLYTHLTRSDLASIGTLPAGPFDLVVSSDVLVYFGDLGPVLANLATITRPGGWLILTLELAEDTRSWALAPSGRHRHDPAYLGRALQAAGFSAPKHRIDGDLRHDLGQPVRAFAVAAQRLALAFAAPPG